MRHPQALAGLLINGGKAVKPGQNQASSSVKLHRLRLLVAETSDQPMPK